MWAQGSHGPALRGVGWVLLTSGRLPRGGSTSGGLGEDTRWSSPGSSGHLSRAGAGSSPGEEEKSWAAVGDRLCRVADPEKASSVSPMPSRAWSQMLLISFCKEREEDRGPARGGSSSPQPPFLPVLPAPPWPQETSHLPAHPAPPSQVPHSRHPGLLIVPPLGSLAPPFYSHPGILDLTPGGQSC